MPTEQERIFDRAQTARLDRARSSIPWRLTQHALDRLAERLEALVPEVREALAVASRVADSSDYDSEQWLGEVRGRRFIALSHVDDREAVRVVRTFIFAAERPVERRGPRPRVRRRGR